jgi:hypothetical protein
MKKYIGSVSEYTGQIRMLDTKKVVVPHILGGANDTDAHTFISYEESTINKEFLKKHGLRFLTEEEVAHFLKGENIYGEKVKKPEAPKISEKEKAEMKTLLEETIKEYEAEGKEAKFLKELLAKY